MVFSLGLLAGCGEVVLDEGRDGAGDPDASALATSDARAPEEALTGCVVAAIRGDEVLLASPSGQEQTLDRDPVWNEQFTAAWRLGDQVLLAATGEQLVSQGAGTWMGLVDRDLGLVWQGRAPRVSDYLPTKGFQWRSREGYLLLNDGSVVDRDGEQHVVPEAGFVSTGIAIDASAHLLVQRGEALAYWNVAQGTLEPLSARGLSAAVVGPVYLGERDTMQAAYVERSEDGFALVRVDHRSHDRVALTREASQEIAAALTAPSTVGTEPRVHLLTHANAALLLIDERPAGWARVGEQPKALSDADFPAQLTRFDAQGGCFAAASRAATSTEELLLGLVRVHAGDGVVERGVRAGLPEGLVPVMPDDPDFEGAACVGSARIALQLRGPKGVAWFVEAGSVFEQLGGWNEHGLAAVHEANAADPMHTEDSPRIDYGYGYGSSTEEGCVVKVNENGSGVRIEEATRRRLHNLLGDNAAAAFVGSGTEPSSR